ncbi:conserved hypothetical protein [Ricinus communis]|uniref:RNase H type-1 domain-containing protein n=1 Tax=Ricinus communis TaxID=3988 RepID=B9SJU0_RICCO|nr:conserved hypothetical protein [Ricinus communis]
MSKGDWDISFRHVHREGNSCADYLANMGFDCDFGCHIVSAPPVSLRDLIEQDIRRDLIEQDILGVPLLRICIM